jgi:hypothetical protein
VKFPSAVHLQVTESAISGCKATPCSLSNTNTHSARRQRRKFPLQVHCPSVIIKGLGDGKPLPGACLEQGWHQYAQATVSPEHELMAIPQVETDRCREQVLDLVVDGDGEAMPGLARLSLGLPEPAHTQRFAGGLHVQHAVELGPAHSYPLHKTFSSRCHVTFCPEEESASFVHGL